MGGEIIFILILNLFNYYLIISALNVDSIDTYRHIFQSFKFLLFALNDRIMANKALFNSGIIHN